jgi:hypothetical protein
MSAVTLGSTSLMQSLPGGSNLSRTLYFTQPCAALRETNVINPLLVQT